MRKQATLAAGAMAAIVALTVSASGTTLTCKNPKLAEIVKDGTGYRFAVLNKDVKWKAPRILAANDDGDYVLPSGRKITPRPPAGSRVELFVAEECERRSRFWVTPPEIKG